MAEQDAVDRQSGIGNMVAGNTKGEVGNEVQHEIPEIKVSCCAGGECLGQLRYGRTERDNKNDGGECIQHLLGEGRQSTPAPQAVANGFAPLL